MSCEGWNDGEKCNISIDEATDVTGTIVEIDKDNHKILVKFDRASSLKAKIKGMDESEFVRNAFWIEAHAARKAIKHVRRKTRFKRFKS